MAEKRKTKSKSKSRPKYRWKEYGRYELERPRPFKIATEKIKSKIKKPYKPAGLKQLLVALCGIALIAVFVILTFMFVLSPKLGFLEPGADAWNLFGLVPGLSTAGYKMVELDVMVGEEAGVVTLTAGCKRIVAYVEAHQAESIYRGINKEYIDRPNAHDITADLLREFNIDVILVKVTEIRDGSFYGKIIMKKGNKIASLDARPSDATAIAVRVGAPVYVKNELLEDYGEEIC
jgi:bifunctional DNase/RNase